MTRICLSKRIVLAVAAAAASLFVCADTWVYSDNLVADITVPAGGYFDVGITKALSTDATYTNYKDDTCELVPCVRYGEIVFYDKVSERFLKMRGGSTRATTSSAVGPAAFTGVTRTWTGGGTARWSDSANWGGEAAPGSGEKALIPASLTAQVGDDDVALVAALAEIEVAEGAQLILTNRTKALALSANLVGGGSLSASSTKALTLSGSNEWFYGPFTFSSTPVTVTSHMGLGSPSRAIAHNSNRLLFKGNGLTNEVPVEIQGNRNDSSTWLTEKETDRLVFNAQLKFPATIQFAFGYWEFNDGIEYVGSMYAGSVKNYCHPVVRGRPLYSKSTYFPFSFGADATLELAAPGSVYKDFAYYGPSGSRTSGIVCGCTNALSTTTFLALGKGTALDATLNLNGYDQSVQYLRYSTYDSNFVCTPTRTSTGYGLIFSDEKPAVLTMTGTSSATTEWRVAYKFSGKVSLVKQGKETYTLLNQYSDTTGKLTVEDGTVAFDWSAGWGGDIEVKAGMVRMLEGAQLNVTTPPAITVAEGAKFYVTNGLSLVCRSLTLGDTQVPTATLVTSNNYPNFIQGGGELFVKYVAAEHVWTGAAGNGDLTDPANWEEGNTPTFDGNDVCMFTNVTSDLNLTVPAGGLTVNQIKVQGRSSVSNEVRFAGGALTIVGSGLSVTPTSSTTPLVVTFANDIVLSSYENETWTVAEGATLVVTGDISGGRTTMTLNFEGTGAKILAGDNVGMLSQLIQSSSGLICARSETALGSPSRYTKISGDGLRFDFATVMTNVTPLTVASGFGTSALASGRTLAQKGGIKITGGVPTPNFKQTWIFLGGMFADAGNWWMSGGDVHFRETPINVSASWAYFVTGFDAYVETTNNVVPRWHVSGVLNCLTSNILSQTSTIALGSPAKNGGGTWNLNGFDQDVPGTSVYNKNITDPDYSMVGLVKSAKPARLRITGTKTDQTYVPWQFREKVSFELASESTIRLIRWNSDTTGYLKVSNGTLQLVNGAGFTKTPEVTISGGKLVVSVASAYRAFGTAQDKSAAQMFISGSGQLELAEGGTATVRRLFVEGQLKRAGYYGSATCTDARVPEENKLAALAGAGVLHVLRGGGFALIVK